MTIESREVISNGRDRSFVECPCCGQKFFNVVTLAGVTEVVVKCRRCRRFIKIRLTP